MNNSKVRSHHVFLVSRFSFFVVFNILISVINANMVSGQPPCYLIDANGNRVNLSGICGKSPQTAVIRQNTATTPTSENTSVPPDTNSGNNPDANSGNNQPIQDNQATQGNQPTQDNQTNSGSTTRVTGSSISVNEKQETESYRFVPKIQRRRIPLLQ